MRGKKFFQRVACLVFAVMTVVMMPVPAGALSESDMYFYGQNGIYFYDPNGGGRGGCYSGDLSGDTVMAKIVDYLTGNNPTGFVLSDNGIAGILANFEGESGFNPFRFQGDTTSGPAYGVAQFDPMSKILAPLRSDPRTSNYYNEYYDIKYTRFDASTGIPDGVPMEVVDAWLAVQLDFFFGPSSEFETTKVEGYRNLGGAMGLDYIGGSMTAHEAMDAARSPEDAARIFVWIMERPKDKAGAASGRSQRAVYWLDYVQSIKGTVSGSGTGEGTNAVDGSNVTIIGDSITVGSEAAIRALMPNVDIHAQVSKQFYAGDAGNPGGITILKELIEKGSLRDVLIYALGTNGGITTAQAEEVVQLAGDARKVIFVTNYTTSNDYAGNNNIFAKMRNEHSNVKVADWKAAIEGQTGTYLGGDGIHPNAAGQELFASVLANTVGASGSNKTVCVEESVDGGLTDAQAQKLADYYNSDAVDAAEWGLPYGKMNCVSFSLFFVERFTSMGKGNIPGNGRDIAHNLAQMQGLETGTAPRPYAVFSVTQGSTMCGATLCGHTGIVVAVDGDTITVVEAAYKKSLAKVTKYDISYFVNLEYGDTFAYLASILDEAALAEVLGD